MNLPNKLPSFSINSMSKINRPAHLLSYNGHRIIDQFDQRSHTQAFAAIHPRSVTI
jgi:hypothetical protein